MIMRTTRNQRHRVHTKQTYSLKKLRTGKLVLALVGSFTVGAATLATSVNATEWIARTAEEIKQDIGNFSKPYTIKWGDTLSAIQEATGIDYHKIAADNGIEDVNLIYAGNILYNKNGYTAVANVQTGEVKVYQAQTPTPTANTQAAVSNAVAKTVVKDVTDSKDEKVQEIKQALQQSVNPNGQVTEKVVTQPAKAVETSNQPTNQATAKPAETPSQPVEQPTVKPVETPSQPVEQPVVKSVETPSQPVEQPTVKPAETPSQPAEQPTVKPTETPSQPVEQPAVKPAETPSQPVEQPTVKPAETPSQPVEQPTVKPVETPSQPIKPFKLSYEKKVVKSIPFKEEIFKDPKLDKGRIYREEGVEGLEEVIFEVEVENGKEIDYKEISRKTIKSAKNAVVHIGIFEGKIPHAINPESTQPTQPVEQPAVKPVETPSQPAETTKPIETKVETEKGEPLVQPKLPELVVETETVNHEIMFEETTQEDPELLEGNTRREEGVKGNEQVVFEIVKENGVVKSRTETSRKVTVAAKNAITYRGTKKATPEQPAVKPVETRSQPVERAAAKPVETEKGEPEVQPELPELVVETVNNEIKFEETTQDDPELLEGKTRREEGSNGNEQVMYEVVKENGVVKSRTEISRKVTVAAKNAITYRGTKKAAPAQPVVTTKVVTEVIEKDIVEKVIEDDSIAQGKSVVESNGTKPRTEQDYTVVKVNNEVVSKEAKGEPREIDGTPKVVRKGTGHLLKYDAELTTHKPVDGYTWESLNKIPDEEKSRIANDTEEIRDIRLDAANAEEDMKIANQLLNLKRLNEEFLKLVNAERATQGRKPLVADENLIKLAKIRSDEQAGVGSLRSNGKPHTRPDGTSFASVFNTLENANERYGTRGENTMEDSSMVASAHAVLNATQLAQNMFERWESSPGHYRNMMSDQWTSFGLSASFSPYSTTSPEYYTGKTMIGVTVFANDYDLQVQ